MDPGYSSATDSAGKTNRWKVREKYTSLVGLRPRFGKTNGAGRRQPDDILPELVFPVRAVGPSFRAPCLEIDDRGYYRQRADPGSKRPSNEVNTPGRRRRWVERCALHIDL